MSVAPRPARIAQRAAALALWGGAALRAAAAPPAAAGAPGATGEAPAWAGPALLPGLLSALLLALLLALGLAWAAAALARRNRQLADTLHAARQQASQLDDMLDLWQWQTDSEHRVVSVRPPRGAAPAEWAPGREALPLWAFVGSDDEAALRAQLERHAVLDELPVQRRPGPAGGPGQPVRARLSGRARLDTLGAFQGYAGVLRDLPEAPAAAGAASAAEPDSESFSYTVSHDLRAPIRVVEGFAKILKEDYGRQFDRIGNDHLDRVLGAAARMNSMIDALLALSRLSSQPLARQPVDLSQLARYVGDDLRRQTPGREVALHIEPGLRATGDPTLLRLVIENLLGNAWKYTGRCAQAQIWLERQGQQSHVFTVRDNGAGFDMRFADRLFGVFQRLHSASEFPGTGVGLASVRRIVRRHGGDVWAEAEVGRGASFHFTLESPRG